MADRENLQKAYERYSALQKERQALQKELQLSEKTKQQLQKQCSEAQAGRQQAELQLLQMQQSMSWKMSEPLRILSKITKKPPTKQQERQLEVQRRGEEEVAYCERHFGSLYAPPLAPLSQGVCGEEKISLLVMGPISSGADWEKMMASIFSQSHTNWELFFTQPLEHIPVHKQVHSQSVTQWEQLPASDCLLVVMGPVVFLPGAFAGLLRQPGAVVYSDHVAYAQGDLRQVTQTYCKTNFGADSFYSYDFCGPVLLFRQPPLGNCEPLSVYASLLAQAEKGLDHVAEVLYLVPEEVQHSAADSHAKARLLEAHLQALGRPAVCRVQGPYFQLQYELQQRPLVSIIIPTCDEPEMLENCVRSILEKSTYENYEILLCENGSIWPQTFALYEKLLQNPRLRLCTWEQGFNYAAINNYAAGQARGSQLLFLNNDTQVIGGDWIEQMLMFSQREDIGAVGAKLYFPDDTLQHGGVVLGMFGLAAHGQIHQDRQSPGYMGNLLYARNVSCVTGACLMVKKEYFDSLQGFDEGFAVGLNDVDFCLRLRQRGFENIFTPFAELYHFESVSRGWDLSPEKKERSKRESDLFFQRWDQVLQKGDPYWNPHFRIDCTDYIYDV